MIEAITNINDVEQFFNQLIGEGVNFHPDDDFGDYIDCEAHQPTFTSDEATLRNTMLDDCFTVCEQSGVDIYELAQEIFLKGTGMDAYIPCPSAS
jgi:hypothetical protein